MALKHNKDAIKVKVGKGVTVDVDTTIHVPAWYVEQGLFRFLDEYMEVLAVFPIIQGNNYSMVEAMVMYQTKPDKISMVTINNESYYELSYNKGSDLIINLEVPQDGMVAVIVFDKMVLGGKYPYYYTYKDALSIVRTSNAYAGINIDSNSEIQELLVSLSARNTKGDLYRLDPKGPVSWVALSKTHFGDPTAYSKMTGSYQMDGMTSALITDTKNASSIEKILTDKD